ncbi:unnamed protein product [Pedinophyceae sp. YPF-701]|nr:unnamed protein product [Pedinophyceae sp. YPF-701]
MRVSVAQPRTCVGRAVAARQGATTTRDLWRCRAADAGRATDTATGVAVAEQSEQFAENSLEAELVAAVRSTAAALSESEAGKRDLKAARRNLLQTMKLGKDLVSSYTKVENFKQGWEWTRDGGTVLARDLSRVATLRTKSLLGSAEDPALQQALALAEKKAPGPKQLVLFSFLVLNTVPLTFLIVPLLRACFPGKDDAWLPSAFSQRRRAAMARLRAGDSDSR